MNLTFSVEQIEQEFIKPFQMAGGPPVMVDLDDYDAENDDGGMVQLVCNQSGRCYLASDRAYGEGLPPVVLADEHPVVATTEVVQIFDSLPLAKLIEMTARAKSEGQDQMEIELPASHVR